MVKRKSRKKNYNPFKMWGSYIGGIIFLLIPALIDFGVEATILEIIGDIALVSGFFLFATGFLIGYGIHAGIRAVKR